MDKTKIAIGIFDALAKVYEQKFMDVSLYHESLDFFCQNLKVTAQILEIACGPGNLTKYLLQQNPDLEILATDLSHNMIALAQANNPNLECQLLDGRDILSVGRKFDAVLCGFALPYLSKAETEKFIADAAKILNPDGLLYLSTMEDDYAKSGWKTGSSGDQIFMHYHQADYLQGFLGENHLSIIYLERIRYPGPENTTTTDLVLIGKKS